MNKTLEDVEFVTFIAREEGYDVRHYGILIEDAVGGLTLYLLLMVYQGTLFSGLWFWLPVGMDMVRLC